MNGDKRWWFVWLGGLLIGCGAEVSVSEQSGGDGTQEQREDPGLYRDDQSWRVQTYLDEAETRALFEQGVVKFEEDLPFVQVAMLIDADDVSGFSYRAGVGDDWRPWAPVIQTFKEGRIHSGLILLEEEATRLELRGAEGASYLHLEFSGERLAPEKLVFGGAAIFGEEEPVPGGHRETLEQERADLDRRHQALEFPAKVVTRQEWGAHDPDRICNDVVAPYRMAVHHTAGQNNDSDPYGRMRAIQNFHINGRGWCDIGYHFVVAPSGEIFEGRLGSDRPAAHVGGQNHGNVGLCMMGTYTSVAPSAELIDGIVAMMKWVHRTHGVALDRTAVLGHREHEGAATECPGTTGITYVDPMVERAAAEIAMEDLGEVSLWVEAELEDFVREGSSAGVPDALVGNEFEVAVYLSNQTGRDLSEVRVAYAFEDRVSVRGSRLESDAPLFGREVFQEVDILDGSRRPEDETPGLGGDLSVGPIKAGETRRMVFEVRAESYDFGRASPVLARAWVQEIDELMVQQSDEETSGLSGAVQVDLFSSQAWVFEGVERDDREGWTGVRSLEVREGALRYQAAEGDLGVRLRAPSWTAIDAERYDEAVVRMHLPVGDHRVRLGWGEAGGVDFLVRGGSSREIVVPLGGQEDWLGVVKSLRWSVDRVQAGEVALEELYFQNRDTEQTSGLGLDLRLVRPVELLTRYDRPGRLVIPMSEEEDGWEVGTGGCSHSPQGPQRGLEGVALMAGLWMGARIRRGSRRRWRGSRIGCRDQKSAS